MSKKTRAPVVPGDMVFGWPEIGAVLGVSYMTAKRWARKDASLRSVIQCMRSVSELGTGKRRVHVMASRAALLGWAKKIPSLEDAARMKAGGRRNRSAVGSA